MEGTGLESLCGEERDILRSVADTIREVTHQAYPVRLCDCDVLPLGF